MKIYSSIIFSVVLVFVLTISVDLFAKEYPNGSPTRAIQDLDKKMDTFKIGKLTKEDEEYNRKLKKDIIHGTFDVRELSRLSLGTHWNTLDDKQKNEFVDILSNLLEERALLSKEQSASKSKKGGKYTVSYQGDKFINPEKNRSFVRTTIHLIAENIKLTLNYKMNRPKDEWKIFDVIVDEASLVDNYKYQFNSIIKKHGYPELVRRMQKKLHDVKMKRQVMQGDEEKTEVLGSRSDSSVK